MSTEEIRTLIKVHIQAAESVGKMEAAMGLLGLLDAIDADIAERKNAESWKPLNSEQRKVVEDFIDQRKRDIDAIPKRGLRADVPPVDRSARVLVDGSPVTDEHLEINPATGMQKDYVVLTTEERTKGFVRPVRNAYIHVGAPPEGEDYSRFKYPIRGDVKPFTGGCLVRTQMNRAIAETYARDPKFYSGTFCVNCAKHLPLDQFIWEGTTERVGS